MVCMYVPAHFAAGQDELAELLASITALDLISPGPDGLLASFLPMLYDPHAGPSGALLGHLARTNPHWQSATGESLAIVRGPDGYVSPSWYASKAEHGRVVPTWNYLTAHVYGRLVVHDDVDWLRSLVTRLTERHEAALAAASGGQPWSVADAPATFVDGQLRAIVGVELVISRIEAKSKLSQNRSEADRAGVLSALATGSARDQELARAMAVDR